MFAILAYSKMVEYFLASFVYRQLIMFCSKPARARLRDKWYDQGDTTEGGYRSSKLLILGRKTQRIAIARVAI